MKSVKVKSVMKSVKVESTVKSTKIKSVEPTHQTKPRATTETFKTTERSRVYSRGYREKIAELKRVGGRNPEEDKELARAYAKALLVQVGFSVRG